MFLIMIIILKIPTAGAPDIDNASIECRVNVNGNTYGSDGWGDIVNDSYGL